MNDVEWLTPKECADMIKVRANTLTHWRKDGKGPPWHGVGDMTRYLRSEVNQWILDGCPGHRPAK